MLPQMSQMRWLHPCWRLTLSRFLLTSHYSAFPSLKKKTLGCRRALQRGPILSANPFCGGLCYSHTGQAKEWHKPAGYDTGIKTYNSLTRRKEPLILANKGAATWYSCGPTVYDHAHLGHACSYVRFDILRRILKSFGNDVITVMVITDIDDKIIKRANELSISPFVLAQIYEEDFKQDMAALKVLPPAVYMRVTENIPAIISFIKGIINNGHAYATSKGNVYFAINSIGDRYGKLVGTFADVGTEPDSDKWDAKDFALWKASKPQEPFWDSPWGTGRPGWHIECSTIASSVFGSQLDIHTGGIDLAFPHHENEIAQCEAYHKCEQWGNYFLHSGHLHLKGSEEKMSKSLKNYITIKDFLQTSSANQFRMFCLLSKYRSAIEYSDASLSEAKSILNIISSFTNDASAYMKGQLLCNPIDEGLLMERLATAKTNVQTALADDFDTPRAVDAIMDLIHHGNRQLQVVTKAGGSPRSPFVYGAIITYVEQFLDTVGLSLTEPQDAMKQQSLGTFHSVVDQLVNFRSKVRNYALGTEDLKTADTTESTVPSEAAKEQQKEKRKQLLGERAPLLQVCDVLRQDLTALGVHIKDRGNTSTWEVTEQRAASQANKESPIGD
ncbi:probable cysteine--tRNA ligase, mitochondrial isoform X1 [Latimeria chalumnae]|uniref:cysteine--tRNA ligase n=1 Tax=Latimeria chalumnae TaxID=7897 RepID=H3AIF6_LATCH|nr:PREDICTED: probable cysteine--tRNA ligase, mitochondrial isoform X1 [Latimeria chalumnae]|eukprot:XP_005999444.1 PREDICTED: probable cysteine--tRNA ligase, mitochondrial isoform X1 [Latimeria chalumnae]